MTKIKICGLFRPCDIDFVNEAKPDYCGFVIHFPKSHRSVEPDQVRLLTARLDPEIVPVGVFVDEPPENVAALLNDGVVSVAQLHGGEDEDYLASLRRLAPGCEIWKAYKIRTAADIAAANGSTARQILLDNGAGTGKTFDWSLTSAVRRPFFLAGGLNPENLREAVLRARPVGVDLSSGVETNRLKDPAKILAAVAAIRG